MHYTTGQWSGLPNYSCAHCPFETLDEAEMLQHIIDRHLDKPAEPEKKADPMSAEAEVPGGTDLPVLLVTREQLSNIIGPAPISNWRKEH